LSAVSDTDARSPPDSRVLSINGKSNSPTMKLVSTLTLALQVEIRLPALVGGQELRHVKVDLHFAASLL
jgi:hypothetical protein